MRKTWKYILFFVVCLAVVLLATMPVQVVLPYAKLPGSVQLSGVHGGIFSGRVSEVVVNNFPLRDVRYRVQPGCLVLLEACYRVHFDRGELQVTYSVLNGNINLNNTRLSYQVSELISLIPPLLVNPTGQLEMNIDDISMLQGKLQQSNGQLVWRDLGFEDQNGSIGLGDYQLDFVGNAQGYEFRIRDLDASLKMDGDGKLGANGQYTVDIKVSSESAIDTKIRNMLDLIASSSAYNKYRIEQTGRLPPQVTRQLF